MINTLFEDFKSFNSSFVFPPSRGPIITETVEPNTGMYVEFKRSIQDLTTAKPDTIENSARINKLLHKVLDGRVSKKDGQYLYIANDSGAEMPLSASAASIRELASFEFLIENAEISKSAIMIDEPEAHLHPLKQRMMADIMACLLSEGAHIQITTHSDYFLRRFNELVIQHKLFEESKKNTEIEYRNICENLKLDPDLYINEDLVSAYLIQRKDSSSIVIKQDMNKGVPFSSFHDALNDSLFTKNELDKYLHHADN